MIRRGGRYFRTKAGELRPVAPPTPDHPKGNAPRDAEGNRIDRPAPAAAPPPAKAGKPAPAKPDKPTQAVEESRA